LQKVWSYAIATLIIGLVIGAAVGYVVKPVPEPVGMVSKADFDALKSDYDKTKAELDKTKVDLSKVQTDLTAEQAKTKTLEAEIEKLKKGVPLKAGWIYVGPIGDFGWTYAHDQGRLYAEKMLPWLKTVYVETVLEADCPRVIDRLFVEEGCDVVFTTSFGFGPATIEAGKKYPDKILFHCSGFERRANVGTYFADFYQVFYLNGLAAGALTKTKKLGYVGAFPIPELIRHLNAFLLGAQEIDPAITLDTRWTYSWVLAPEAAIEAAEGLIAEGCDTVSQTIDTPDIPRTCEKHTDAMDMGYPIYGFSHYSPMVKFAPDAILTGQLVRWGPIYVDILMKVHEGIYTPHNLENVDYWDLLATGNVEVGSDFGVPINPKWVSGLKEKMVTEKITGKQMSVYDLIMLRLEQMSEEAVLFDPFTGPIYDTEGNLKILPGTRASHDELWSMMWGVKGVSGIPKA